MRNCHRWLFLTAVFISAFAPARGQVYTPERAGGNQDAVTQRKVLREPREGESVPGSLGPGRQPADFGSVSALERYIEEQKGRTQGEDEEKTGIDLLESWVFYLQQRAYPNDTVNWSAYQRAVEHREAMTGAHLEKRGQRASWEFVGPTNLPVPYRIYFGQGALNGRVNTTAFDPAHRGTYYMGSAGGGVWKTVDGGKRWKPLTDSWPFLQVSSLAVDPSGKIIYAGTGDFPYPVQSYSCGLMKSTDSGATWESIGPPELKNFAISKILMDPENPRVLTVTAGRGAASWGNIWRSADGGATWKMVVAQPAAWCDVECGARDKKGDRSYYAVGYDSSGFRRVLHSTDRGLTWKQVFQPGPYSGPGLSEVATSPTDPSRAYAIFGSAHQVWQTEDAGATWKNITGNLPGDYNWSQDWYDLWINASSRNDSRGNPHDLLYVGLIDVCQGVNGEWRSIGQTYTTKALTHNDQQSSAVDRADPNRLLIGSDGGVYRLDYAPRSDQWSFISLNSHLGITQFYRAAYHPTNPDVMLAGTQDNATPMCSGDLEHWSNVGGGDGAFCAINSKDPQIQYASSQFLWLYRTTDSWKTSRFFSPDFGSDRRAFIAPFTLDPNHPNLLYAGTNYLWRWDETTRQWTGRLGGQSLSASGFILYIAVAPGDGNRIYTGSSQGEVWMTMDGGDSWTQINSGSTSLPDRAITSIAVNPSNLNSILVGLSGTGTGHLWQCSNTTAGSARTWRNVSGSGREGLPDVSLNTVTLDPEKPGSIFYVGTDVGVFYTGDGGCTWKNATGPLGLPNVEVNDLEVAPGTGYLNAATFGRGMWRIKLGKANPYPLALPVEIALLGCALGYVVFGVRKRMG